MTAGVDADLIAPADRLPERPLDLHAAGPGELDQMQGDGRRRVVVPLLTCNYIQPPQTVRPRNCERHATLTWETTPTGPGNPAKCQDIATSEAI
jgi:hypothetical protein